MRTMIHRSALACLVALAGCGGGDDEPAAAAPVAGLYEGSGGSQPASKLLILDTGRYYLVYGLNSASAAPVGGVVVGDGTASGTSFSSSNAHDFDLQAKALLTATLATTLVPATSAATTVTHAAGGTASYSGSFDPASSAGASLSALAGTYGGELAGLGGTDASVLTVDGSGALAGGGSGNCTYAGIAQAHGSGNVYDIRLTFGSDCPSAGSTLRGHAFLSGKTLYAVVVSGDLATVALFAGVKP
ncbi:hypothetical protein [Piscinibacter sp. XHJ-5]|uniref:hypothetical protein n=1 Tax=Piscinibacter sp. XHJ-5 TaxID=3037797 RepID=UPI00245301B6|nr:hypothetical protein [Piscinibacter sp. XHJ-5]